MLFTYGENAYEQHVHEICKMTRRTVGTAVPTGASLKTECASIFGQKDTNIHLIAHFMLNQLTGRGKTPWANPSIKK